VSDARQIVPHFVEMRVHLTGREPQGGDFLSDAFQLLPVDHGVKQRIGVWLVNYGEAAPSADLGDAVLIDQFTQKSISVVH